MAPEAPARSLSATAALLVFTGSILDTASGQSTLCSKIVYLIEQSRTLGLASKCMAKDSWVVDTSLPQLAHP